MDTKYPSQIDPRPKRRKDKDNPYEIFTAGIDTDEPHFYISFSNGKEVKMCMEIKKELYDLFDRFELDDISFLNEQERHYALPESGNKAPVESIADESENVEDAVIAKMQNQMLREAIKGLPEVQRRRLILHCFHGLSYEKIARLEGCAYQPVQRSVERAKEKIEKFFKNRGVF